MVIEKIDQNCNDKQRIKLKKNMVEYNNFNIYSTVINDDTDTSWHHLLVAVLKILKYKDTKYTRNSDYYLRL